MKIAGMLKCRFTIPAPGANAPKKPVGGEYAASRTAEKPGAAPCPDRTR